MIQRLQEKRNEEGFTLIELLIVIIVLGILAAIVVFAVGSTRKDSVASTCKTNFKSVELSAEAVNVSTGNYPTGTVAAGATYNITAGFPTANPLVSGAVTPSNGALLKAFPTSSDYALQYVGTAGTPAAGATPAIPSSFIIKVYKAGSVDDAAVDGALVQKGTTTAALAASPASGLAACDGL